MSLSYIRHLACRMNRKALLLLIASPSFRHFLQTPSRTNMSSLVTSLPTITNTFVRASASRNGTSAATITRLAGKSTSTTLRHLGTGTAYATRTLTATRQPISTSLSKGNGGISLGTLVVVVIAGLLLLASGVAVWFLRLSYMRKRRAMTSSEGARFPCPAPPPHIACSVADSLPINSTLRFFHQCQRPHLRDHRTAVIALA